MRLNFILAGSLLLVMLSLIPSESLACTPAVESARVFVQHAPSDAVGFTGKVVAIAQKKGSAYGTPLIVTVKTEKWFLGRPQKIMLVDGYITSNAANNPCGGVFDFHPQVGSKVVIFGHVSKGTVRRSSIYGTLPRVRFSYKK